MIDNIENFNEMKIFEIFNNFGEYLDNIFTGSMSMLGGVCIIKEELPIIGDINNDTIVDVVDIVKIVNHIIDATMLSPYEMYASDIDENDLIDIIDIVAILNIIFR